ncbi:hypothetical protein [Microcoleus sp. N3A4]|uniref:hypothetical protein n=1 Tax=Microcoleus sp. N3A4 TaxID=3055379 RepID=UPI002FCF687B
MAGTTFEILGQQSTDLRFEIFNSQQSTVNSQQSTDLRFEIFNSQQSTVNSQQSTVNSQPSRTV